MLFLICNALCKILVSMAFLTQHFLFSPITSQWCFASNYFWFWFSLNKPVILAHPQRSNQKGSIFFKQIILFRFPFIQFCRFKIQFLGRGVCRRECAGRTHQSAHTRECSSHPKHKTTLGNLQSRMNLFYVLCPLPFLTTPHPPSHPWREKKPIRR